MIASGAIHATHFCAAEAAENITTANHEADFDADLGNFFDLFANRKKDLSVDGIALFGVA